MTPDNKPIPMADMNHLTGLSGLSADSITGLLDTATGFKQTLRSGNAPFNPTLKNRRIALVFFENSTRWSLLVKIEGDPLNTQHAQHRPVQATAR